MFVIFESPTLAFIGVVANQIARKDIGNHNIPKAAKYMIKRLRLLPMMKKILKSWVSCSCSDGMVAELILCGHHGHLHPFWPVARYLPSYDII